jgi:CheY-like chemotaxis protein
MGAGSKKYKELPIIALTANAIHGVKEMFFKCGFNDFISKPIDTGELAKLLKEWLPRDKVTLTNKKKPSAPKTDPELVRFFNRRLPAECERISALLDSHDIEGFAIAIHALKSSLAIIGEIGLSTVAEELESAAKKDDLAHCRKYYVRFEKRLHELHQRLSVIYPIVDETPTEKPVGDAKTLCKAVSEAISAAEDFDGDLAVEHLKLLSEFNFGDEITASLQEALTAFEDFEFDRAAEILRAVEQQ